jgi:hypothetical protein
VVIAGVHSDNEPVFKSKAWPETCNRPAIDEMHSVPYEPAMNGTVERLVQTLKLSGARSLSRWGARPGGGWARRESTRSRGTQQQSRRKREDSAPKLDKYEFGIANVGSHAHSI